MLGLRQRPVMTRLMCIIGADDRDGPAVAACINACVRAANSLVKFWNDISVEAVVYWLDEPAAAQVDNVLAQCEDDRRWSCKPWASLLTDVWEVNGPEELWPLQPSPDDDRHSKVAAEPRRLLRHRHPRVACARSLRGVAAPSDAQRTVETRGPRLSRAVHDAMTSSGHQPGPLGPMALAHLLYPGGMDAPWRSGFG